MPDDQNTSFLGPISIKTLKGKRILDKTQINITAQDKNLVNSVIEILESNKEGDIHISSKDVLDTSNVLSSVPITKFGTAGAIQSSKQEVPNMMNILSQDGVSIERLELSPLVKGNLENPSTYGGLGVNAGNIIAGNAMASQEPVTMENAFVDDLNDTAEKIEDYVSTFSEAFGPESTIDISQFLYTLMLMRKAEYLNTTGMNQPKFTAESLIVQSIAFGLEGILGATKARPNQIMKLIDLLYGEVPINELQNDTLVNNYKRNLIIM